MLRVGIFNPIRVHTRHTPSACTDGRNWRWLRHSDDCNLAAKFDGQRQTMVDTFLCQFGAVGPNEAGRRFLAITDPGSKMQQVAEREQFERCFFRVA